MLTLRQIQQRGRQYVVGVRGVLTWCLHSPLLEGAG